MQKVSAPVHLQHPVIAGSTIALARDETPEGLTPRTGTARHSPLELHLRFVKRRRIRRTVCHPSYRQRRYVSPCFPQGLLPLPRVRIQGFVVTDCVLNAHRLPKSADDVRELLIRWIPQGAPAFVNVAHVRKTATRSHSLVRPRHFVRNEVAGLPRCACVRESQRPRPSAALRRDALPLKENLIVEG